MGMVAGHHLVWSVYGWWLPNDPRGSSSHEVRVPALGGLGELHHGRKEVQPSRGELRDFQGRASPLLAHAAQAFSDDEVALIAESFGDTIRRRRYTCYACAIMPDHVHLLIRVHRAKAEDMQAALQDHSRETLLAAGRRRGNHPVWGGRGWKVFQYTRQDMERIVRYIERNPAERGMPPQHWGFVTPYDGWLPGVGSRR